MEFQGSLRAYLFSSVQHNCIKLIKSRRRYHFDGIENYEDLLEDRCTPGEMEEEKERLYAEIEKLPEQCRKVFEAIVLKDMKYKEAAEQLNLSVNTIKTHKARSYIILRKKLEHLRFLLLALVP